MSPTLRQVSGAFPVPQTLFPLFLDRTLFPPFLDRRQHCDRETRGTCLRVGVGGVRFRLNRVRGAICVSSRETLHNSGHQTSIQNAFRMHSVPALGSISGFDEESLPPHHICIRLHIVVPLASVVSCWMPSIAAEYYMKIFPILQKSGKWLG